MWNWQKDRWPEFNYESCQLEALEQKFIYYSGVLLGLFNHIDKQEKNKLIVDIVSDEAINTSAIEGEYLNRDSVQSSIQQYFGLSSEKTDATPAEIGIAEMMIALYSDFGCDLSHEVLYQWHEMVSRGRRDLESMGKYRRCEEPMVIISGSLPRRKIHFEAPPSKVVQLEMKQFIQWFNHSRHLPPLTRSGIAHLYFVCIHPFEDGNGRIARALAEKVLAQRLEHPILIALSRIIQQDKKAYYQALADNSKELTITSWLCYFANAIVTAQKYTQTFIEFLIAKTKFLDRFKHQLNRRQHKVVLRIFKEGLEGFKGGLSAENYRVIAKTSASTATRDLQDLVKKSVLIKTGQLKGSRYYLNL